jgi:hypothetical protein
MSGAGSVWRPIKGALGFLVRWGTRGMKCTVDIMLEAGVFGLAWILLKSTTFRYFIPASNVALAQQYAGLMEIALMN